MSVLYVQCSLVFSVLEHVEVFFHLSYLPEIISMHSNINKWYLLLQNGAIYLEINCLHKRSWELALPKMWLTILCTQINIITNILLSFDCFVLHLPSRKNVHIFILAIFSYHDCIYTYIILYFPFWKLLKSHNKRTYLVPTTVLLLLHNKKILMARSQKVYSVGFFEL